MREELQLAELKTDVKYIRNAVDDIRDEVKANTEFRLKAKGLIGGATFASAVLGGFVIYALGKFWK